MLHLLLLLFDLCILLEIKMMFGVHFLLLKMILKFMLLISIPILTQLKTVVEMRDM